MNCIRCNKPITLKYIDPNTKETVEKSVADERTCDYIIASDTIVEEMRPVILLTRENEKTKKDKAEGKTPAPEDYDVVEIDSFQEGNIDPDKIKVEIGEVKKPIQKTGIVCPDCYDPASDTVIWGIHKTRTEADNE